MSLQDQLMQAGLVDKKKAKQISKQKRKEKKQNIDHDQELAEAAKQAKLEKQARDKELNRQRQLQSDKKALQAQVDQLAGLYRLKDAKGDVAYNFTDDKAIKKLWLTDAVVEQIIKGRLCIVRVSSGYEVIPKPIAERIRTRAADAVVVFNDGATTSSTEADDEYYAQFEIPDDLMW